MERNVSLFTELETSCNGEIAAKIEKHNAYRITFDVIGECKLNIKHQDITGKLIKSINKTRDQLMSGSYSFLFVATDDGVLTFEYFPIGSCMLKDIKIIKGGR